jgi:ribokinase
LSSQKPIVVVGSINTDLVASSRRIPAIGETLLGTDFQIHPGGKGANQAVAVARLGYPVRMIGRLGADAFATQLRSHLVETGVNIDGVATSDGSSGVAVILVSERGENSIVVVPGANSKVTPEDLNSQIEIIRGAGLVLAQLEIPIETVLHLAKLCSQEGVPLILDPAPATELPADLFKLVDWFTPNETEAAFFANTMVTGASKQEPESTSAVLIRKGCRGVILKQGDNGVYLATEGGIEKHLPAFPAKVVDTTAAGDAFNGGFATGLMLGKSPLESARFASAVAGISVTRAGAQPSMPNRAEVEALLLEFAIAPL